MIASWEPVSGLCVCACCGRPVVYKGPIQRPGHGSPSTDSTASSVRVTGIGDELHLCPACCGWRPDPELPGAYRQAVPFRTTIGYHVCQWAVGDCQPETRDALRDFFGGGDVQ